MLKDVKHRAPVEIGPRCSYHGPARDPSVIDVIVIHDAEAPSTAAPGVARYGASSNAKASWHFTVDDNVLIRCLPDDVVAWCAPPRNSDGLHIELCGYSRYSKLDWYKHQATLKRAAWQVAKWCKLYGIAPSWLSDSQLEHGHRGLTTHAQVSRVYHKSDHSDPGVNFPRGYFQLLVRRRVRWLG